MSTIPQPGSAIEPKPWQNGLAPAYIGMYLWIAFFDQLGRRALPVGGLGWSLLGAAVAGPLAYLLLYRAPALWGQGTGKDLDALSASTFGAKGSRVIPGLLIAVAQVALFALAVGYAVDLTFAGLAMAGLVDPRSILPVRFGASTIRPPLVLLTALFWCVATALVSLRFTRWIAYLMQFFPLFPAVCLGGAMLATLGGLRTFIPSGVDPATSREIPVAVGSPMAFRLTLQWVFAFSALGGLGGADWGAASLTRRDARVGGWISIGLAPTIIAALALIAVAGHQGAVEAMRYETSTRVARSTIEEISDRPVDVEAPPGTFRAVLVGAFDRRVSFAMLLVFGLASLAPACYGSFVYGVRLADLGPGVSKFGWTMLATLTAAMLIVGNWSDRPELVFNLLGATLAPVAGAMAADYRRHKGTWTGPRRGVNPAGAIAWLVGLGVGLVPVVGGRWGLDRFQPAAVAAFLTAYVVFEILTLVRLESASASPAPASE